MSRVFHVCQVQMIESLTRLAQRPGSNRLDALLALELTSAATVAAQ